MRTVVVLGGPTASGKTALAIRLARELDAEIVGADSRQIYAGMPIGTAAPSAAELAAVPHHVIGFLDPRERYSAARFVQDAAAAIGAIHARGKRAIVAGGTGFYLRSLCGDMTLGHEPDPLVRERLAREVRLHPPEVLHAWLATLDPARASAVPPGDAYRITRALEIALGGGGARREPLPTLRALGIPFAKFALAIAPTDLPARIAARTDAMLAAGLLDEAERIGADAVAADAVGYRDALAYLAGRMTRDELRAMLVRTTLRYAKRQLTWLRSEPDLTWIGAQEADRVVQFIRTADGERRRPRELRTE